MTKCNVYQSILCLCVPLRSRKIGSVYDRDWSGASRKTAPKKSTGLGLFSDEKSHTRRTFVRAAHLIFGPCFSKNAAARTPKNTVIVTNQIKKMGQNDS